MAYGERRGVHKLPGDYSIADLFGFGFAGALGIVVAIVADMYQSEEASALFTINKWFSHMSELVGLGEPPLYAVILILMALGAVSVYYFQPVTLQGAFAQGFGVLAAAMTMAPSDLGTPAMAPSNMPTITEEAPQDTTAGVSDKVEARFAGYVGDMEGRVMRQAVHVGGQAQPARLQQVAFQTQQNVYNCTININVPNGLKDDVATMIKRGGIRGKIHNAETGETFNLFRNSGAAITTAQNGRVLQIRTGVPASTPEAKLYARIEIDKYSITVEEFTARVGGTNTWSVTMTPSNTPLTIQRLSQSYWF